MLPPDRNRYFIYIITACYFIVGLIGISNHEVWLDEAHHFLIAKESTSLSDLFERIKYEGHPQLWSILLFFITRFTDSVFYMQLLNVFIMTSVCFLFLKNSRFPIFLNVMILCGYFFIYEYLVISRSYSLLMLALTLSFIHLTGNPKAWKLYAALLFLSLTHIFGLIICTVICVLFFLNQFEKPGSKKYFFGLLIIINGIVVWSIKIPADHFLYHYDTDSIISYRRLSKTASMFAKGFLPLPDITDRLKWNSNFFTNTLKLPGIIAGLFAFLIPLYFFRKERKLLLFYFISTSLNLWFMHISPVIVGARYSGILFILFIYTSSFLLTKNSCRGASWYLIIICTVHTISGFIMYTADIRNNFSNSKRVASYIEEKHLQNKTIIVSNFSAAPGISCYLHKKVYYAEQHGPGSYCKWNTWPFLLNNDQLRDEIEKQLAPNDTLVLVLNQYYFHTDLHDTLVFKDPRIQFQKITSFNEAMVNNENYFLFYVFSIKL
ncbi:MAG: hypothetical protein H0W61_00955 [Bacteroidetes bacterium]|nr:hypothetical protein [Bacteroidota bacterium]